MASLRSGHFGRTPGSRAWSGRTETGLAPFSRTETASAAALVAATAAALIWVNIDRSSYTRVWNTRLSITLGHHGVALTTSGWINSGLMALFFFVVGLEARREFDIGDLRERRAIIVPLAAGVAGMLFAVGLYLAVNAGGSHLGGWGAAMSTDTAFTLGALALVGPRFSERLRAFLLTVMVIDDIVALVVITTVYTTHVEVGALVAALVGFALIGLTALWSRAPGWVYLVLAVATWVAMSKSGIDPLLVGLVMGLLTYATPAARADLERATELFRGFREQPTPELARAAGLGLRTAISPNERLEELFHPWTSFLVVPLFALSNAGFPISGSFLSSAYRSPVTLGIVAAFVVGKPVGVMTATALVTRMSRGRLRPPVGWLAVAGGGNLVGIGFTLSLLVATLAFTGRQLEEAKVGILTAGLLSVGLSAAVFAAAQRLPLGHQTRLLMGTNDPLADLLVPVDPERDHIRGPEGALVTLVEYGDFECPYCGQAESVVREVLAEEGDVRYVWRHLPLADVHPRAQMAAEAAEAAALQGQFWAMHDQLFDHQADLRPPDLLAYAEAIGLDTEAFSADLRRHAGAARVASDVEGADLSGVSGTPTFFVNGRRHRGAYDVATLTRAVNLAKKRALLGQEDYPSTHVPPAITRRAR